MSVARQDSWLIPGCAYSKKMITMITVITRAPGYMGPDSLIDITVIM